MARTIGTAGDVAFAWGLSGAVAGALRTCRPHDADIRDALACTEVLVNGRLTTTAGQAQMWPPLIHLNPSILDPGHEADRDATFLHEVAHIVADRWHLLASRRSDGIHGRTWRRIMRNMGQDPVSNHDIAVLKARRAKPVLTYKCRACGQEFDRARAVPRDHVCGRCHGELVLVRKREIDMGPDPDAGLGMDPA